MIKAIIFDCFGVLALDSWLPFKNEYFADDPNRMGQATEMNRLMDSGKATYEEFLTKVSKLSGVDYEEAKRRIDHNPPNLGLFEYIQKELKPYYKIGMLSNAGADWLSELFIPDQVALFDEVVLSYQIGHTKPQPEAYRTIMDRLGVSTQECVFVDDQQRYCDGAEQIGMRAILFRDTQRFVRELNHVLEI